MSSATPPTRPTWRGPSAPSSTLPQTSGWRCACAAWQPPARPTPGNTRRASCCASTTTWGSSAREGPVPARLLGGQRLPARALGRPARRWAWRCSADPTGARRLLPIAEAMRRHGRPDIIHVHWTEPYIAGGSSRVSRIKVGAHAAGAAGGASAPASASSGRHTTCSATTAGRTPASWPSCARSSGWLMRSSCTVSAAADSLLETLSVDEGPRQDRGHPARSLPGCLSGHRHARRGTGAAGAAGGGQGHRLRRLGALLQGRVGAVRGVQPPG